MRSSQVNSTNLVFQGSEAEKALHSGAKGLFRLYALYETVYDWISAVSGFHYTIFSGTIEGFFNNDSVAGKVQVSNKLRRNAEDAIMATDIEALLSFYRDPNLKQMLVSGDFSSLRTSQNSESYGTPVFEGLSNIERYPLYIRTLIANNLDRFQASFSHNLLQSTNGTSTPAGDQTDWNEQLKEFRHRHKTLNVDREIQNILSTLINPGEQTLPSPQKFEEELFKFGKKLGSLVKFDGLVQPNQLQQLMELLALVAIYTTLYMTIILKKIVLKPFEIFKCLLLGFTSGVHNGLLPKDAELDTLLIDLKHPFNEIIFSFNSHYESLAYANDNFTYACGKKGPMKVIEKLIANKSEYLMRKLRNPDLEKVTPAIEHTPDLAPDIGATISKDNPIAWIFAFINALEDFSKKLAVTLGVELGKGCRSFYDYVRPSEDSTEVTI